MSSFFDDMTFDLNHASRPMASQPIMPFAWQATADGKVDRHYSVSPADTMDVVQDDVRKVQHRVNTLNRLFEASKKDIEALYGSLGNINKAIAAPKAELDMAKLEIERLKRQNASIVKQAQEQSKRADAAERRADELQALAEKLQKNPEIPVSVVFHRHRTPGDSVRYLSSEVMKHAADNLELAGLAIALRMVAADVDNLPQGDHAR